MAMDDILRLAKGIVVEGEIAKPDRVEELVPYGPWTKATVVDTSLYINHGDGFYFGNVRYTIEGEKYCKQATFHDLWMAGWTSIEFMNDCLAAQKKYKAKPAAAEGYWTMDKLVLWVAKKVGSKDPEVVRDAMRDLPYDDIPEGAFEAVVKFRHKNAADRLRKVRSILGTS